MSDNQTGLLEIITFPSIFIIAGLCCMYFSGITVSLFSTTLLLLAIVLLLVGLTLFCTISQGFDPDLFMGFILIAASAFSLFVHVVLFGIVTGIIGIWMSGNEIWRKETVISS